MNFKTISIYLLLVLMLSLAPQSQASTNEVVKTTVENISFNFIAYGDTRGEIFTDTYEGAVSEHHEEIVSAYLTHDPELIIHTGDLAGAFRFATQQQAFNDSMYKVWEERIPIYFAVGNHEVDYYPYIHHDPFGNYSNYISNHRQLNETYSKVKSADGVLTYSFDHEHIHFIFLDTNHHWSGDTFTVPTEQMEWLEQDLQTTGNDSLVVVAYHQPSYSIREGREDRWRQSASIRESFHNLFVKYDVDLVLSGHDHMYYRTIRDGIYYLTVAGGGAPLYNYDTDADDWQNGDKAFTSYHYTNIEVNASHMQITAIGLDGSELDHITISDIPSEQDIPTATEAFISYPAFMLVPVLIAFRKKMIWR